MAESFLSTFREVINNNSLVQLKIKAILLQSENVHEETFRNAFNSGRGG